MKVSNCCFVKGEAWASAFNKLDYEKAELCPKCGEHCEYIEETTNITKWKFSEIEPIKGTYISMVWEDGSDCECIYNGLDLSIKPLPIYWYLPKNNF